MGCGKNMPEIFTCGQSFLIMTGLLVMSIIIAFIVAISAYLVFKKKYWLFWVLFFPMSNIILYFGASTKICFLNNVEKFIGFAWFFIDIAFLVIIGTHINNIKKKK